MSEQTDFVTNASGQEGDASLLAEQLGSAQELTELGPLVLSSQLTKIHSVSGLKDFLLNYRENLLGSRELPAIYDTYNHAVKNQVRELISLDLEISKDAHLKPFLTSSHHVGIRQLNKMRGLKDNRVLQRYRDAVLAGEAYGWHTLVYGLVLATYSIPLRQGLLHYGHQTLSGFVYRAGRALDLNEETCRGLIAENVSTLPSYIEQTLARNGSPPLLLPK
jgi:urease accessory protein UreF